MKKIFPTTFFLLLSIFAMRANGDETVHFSKIVPSRLKVLAHVNEKVLRTPPAGNKVQVTEKGLEMTYNFITAGHDAIMAEFPVDIKKFNYFEVTLTAENAGMRPYLVLTDAGNEKHYSPLQNARYYSRATQIVKKTGKQKMGSFVKLKNDHKGEYFAYRWGGDDNQVLNFPVKKLMIGIDDHPDSFKGKGKIIFHSITFSERKVKK